MLLTISEFRSRVSAALQELVSELQETTGRHSPEEAEAWMNSLPKASQAFSAPIFKPLHLYFGDQGNLSLEYRLPAASSWCDMVLLGSHESKPAAVIVELKDWVTRADAFGKKSSSHSKSGRNCSEHLRDAPVVTRLAVSVEVCGTIKFGVGLLGACPLQLSQILYQFRIEITRGADDSEAVTVHWDHQKVHRSKLPARSNLA